MREPVFFVHGVATHEPEEFDTCVRKLNAEFPDWDFVPIFWGDLGGKSDYITDAIPVIDKSADRVDPSIIRQLLSDQTGTQVRSLAYAADIIADTAMDNHAEGAAAVRSSSGDQDELRDAVAEAIADTTFLQHVQDPEILKSVGELVGQASGIGSEDTDSTRTRSLREQADSLRGSVKRIIEHVDELLGHSVGHVLGNANQRIRGAVAVPFVTFFGDIFAYQRNQQAIQDRIWQKLAEYGEGYGSEAQPINLVAHSLGGVISFDAAIHGTVDGEPAAVASGERGPLWVKSFVTFGSQSSFFHILDRRQQLVVYKHGLPVPLPRTIARWTNLWDSMDFLGFAASVVFRLHNGQPPRDIPVYDNLSLLIAEKVWTHSIYWQTPQLRQALRDALTPE